MDVPTELVAFALLVGVGVAGVHCSAPSGAEPEADMREARAPERPQPVRLHSAPAAPDDPPLPRSRDYALTSCDGCAITSAVRAADGSTFSAGTFVGRVTFGATSLEGKGLTDAFLVKSNVDGSIAWAIAVGSPEAETSSRVTVQDDGAAGVTLMGLTQGMVDCGTGPLPVYSSETFFLCRFQQKDGAPIEGGSFPGGH